ncbi:ammonium transporter Rh type A-like isoform X2 [Lineus longissimus]|uniref:ammonium transporter Rh type A-like isoform X2 n=1 Tax=Lineus longissimus TaxID=88925 RepID=UPI002B4DED63
MQAEKEERSSMGRSGNDCGWRRGKLTAFLIVFEIIFIVLFAIFIDYDPTANARHISNSLDLAKNGSDPKKNIVKELYPMFQDVHVMMFVGFGFLMTFLKRYGFGSVGLNFLIAAFVIQWATLLTAFLHLDHGRYALTIIDLITSDFAAAAVLISFGAVLGKTSPLQLIIMAFIEIIFFTGNEYIGLYMFKAVDVGGSMYVHVFGAYFGIAVARVIYHGDVEKSQKEGSVYHSDVFAMIGTVFLWMFWPSFNSALAPGDDQHRAVINTYFALAACCVTAFAVSAAVCKEKFDMVHIQNATLAGGVAVGTSADMMIGPFGAMIIGMLAGTLSVLGYKYLSPVMARRLKLHDTCGVNNLHGMPGLLAGIIGTIVASLAVEKNYGYSLYEIFPARAPAANTTQLLEIQKVLSINSGSGRSAGMQAANQVFALLLSLGFAIVGGILTGFIMKIPLFEPQSGGDMFSDRRYWELPDDFVEEAQEGESHDDSENHVKVPLGEENTRI